VKTEEKNEPKSQNKDTGANENAASDVFEKLKELITMKERGLITDDEFKILKQKLMKDI
jgi:hypothetical protein